MATVKDKRDKANPVMGTTGFTPQEAALELTGKGLPFTAKRLRRVLRKGGVEGAVQLSGRWYIPRSALTRFVKVQAKAASAPPKEVKAKAKPKKAQVLTPAVLRADRARAKEGVSMV